MDEDVEIGFGHGVVGLELWIDEVKHNASGACVGINCAVWPGRVRGDFGIELGRIGIKTESGKEDVPSNGVREGVVFFEVAFFGSGEITGVNESVEVGG